MAGQQSAQALSSGHRPLAGRIYWTYKVGSLTYSRTCINPPFPVCQTNVLSLKKKEKKQRRKKGEKSIVFNETKMAPIHIYM